MVAGIQRHGVLLLLAVAVSGCGPVGGVILAGNIVSAAGAAAVDASDAARRAEGDAIRQRGVTEHLVRLGAEQGRAPDAHRLAVLLTERRDPQALRWMCEAAMAGNAEAQLQLGHWYNEDRLREDLWPFINVAPDDRTARAWYTAAARNGQRLATLYEDSLGERPASAAVVMATESFQVTPPDCSTGMRLTSPRGSFAGDEG